MLFYNSHLFAWTVNQWSLIWDNDVLFCSTQQLPHPCLQSTTFTFWSRHGVLQGPWNSLLALLLDLQISGQCRVFWLGCKGPRTLSKTNLDGVFVKSTLFFTVPWWQSNLIELSKWPDMFFQCLVCSKWFAVPPIKHMRGHIMTAKEEKRKSLPIMEGMRIMTDNWKT